MFLAVINKSTAFSDEDAHKAVRACAAQLKLHVAPLWDMVPAPVVFYANEKEAPSGADLLLIFDDPDQAGGFGYHEETPEGKPYGRAFVKPVLDHGGKPLRTDMSVSATISHEVCEWFGDPYINLWADDGGRNEYAVELCDPVEDDSYEIDHIAVSNFVTKRYFDHLAPKGTQFDYMKKLKKPYSMTAGGYVMIRHGTNVQEKYARGFPSWKKELKAFPAARTARRLAQVG